MWIFNSCVVQGSTVFWVWLFSLSLLILRFIHAVGFISSSFYCWVTSCCSVAKSCLTLPDTMDCSMPGFPTPQHLLEFAQVHVHWISDAFQASHHLLHSCPSAFSLSQNQGLFQWVGCLHQVAKVLELQLQHQSFQRIFRVDFL